MKSGLCPKCGSPDVCWKRKGIQCGGGVVYLAVSWNSPVLIDDYVCTNCGYLESYISDREKLSEIAEKWDRMKPKS